MDILPFLRQRAGDFTCPRCRYSLADCGVRIVQQRGPLYTVQVTCRRCELSLLVQLEVQGDADRDGPAAIPSTRSQRGASAPRRAGRAGTPAPAAPPISPDELLDLHLHLAGFEGPLLQLLAPSLPTAPETAHDGRRGER